MRRRISKENPRSGWDLELPNMLMKIGKRTVCPENVFIPILFACEDNSLSIADAQMMDTRLNIQEVGVRILTRLKIFDFSLGYLA